MLKDKDSLIFIHKFLKAIADSIIQVFIPLFILKQTGELALSITYLAVYSLFVALNITLFRKFIQKHTVLCIILHFIPIITAQCLLTLSSINVWIVLSCAFIMSLAQTLYSVPINLVFAFSDKKTNVAKFQIATNFAKLFFILLSGFIISTSKIPLYILCVVSAVLYLVCVIPIMFAYKELKGEYNTFEERGEKKKVDKKFVIFHVAFGSFQAVLDNCIPLFLFINNLSFQAVTIVLALVECMRILSNYLAKWLVKINKERLSCIISCSVYFISSICLVIFKVPVVLYICSCLCSLSFPLTFVPMFKKYCNYLTVTDNIFSGMTERDVEIFSCRPIAYAFYFIGLGLYPSFAFGITAMIVMFIYELKLTSENKIENDIESYAIEENNNNILKEK